MAPQLFRPFGLPCASRCYWDVKKLGFASNRFNVFFQQQLRCSAAQEGALKTISYTKPSHAAEQHSKERISESAERSDFPMSPVLCEQRRVVTLV